ncbi:AAA family ATPase [Anaerovibrio lipolyticus]|uniref:AAA family ATPase n=1 Tax=Anaerovibrio lipolyticus TaxID=82374 RepID=UPI0026E941FA|nr:AAA family ATPase [Anaerovibrio lipolyticus]
MNKFEDNLIRFMDAGFPIIYIDTFEESKAVKYVQSAACGRGIMEWSVTGFCDYATNSVCPDWSLADTLRFLISDANSCHRRVLVLTDIHSYLSDPVVTALLKLLAQKIVNGLDDFNIVMVSPVVVIPPELEKFMSILSMDYLSQSEIKQVVNDFCDEQEIDRLSPQFLDELSMALKGLTEFEICNMLAMALTDDGEITSSDMDLIIEQKQQLIRKSGILEMIPVKEDLSSIGGLENLKNWLQRKGKIFKNVAKAEKFGVDIPKGVLIAGMPGCGKSLNAKAAAKLFNVPLLRMDMGRLMGKYVGESEANMRKAIKLAEAISPCVLWIDELEKAFAGVGGNSGASDVTTRLFGTFLTWLQEKESLAFVVATANDIEKMPPELMRKGRFDEIFYVGLPNKNEREKIFEIHIKKRRPNDFKKIDISALAIKTDGYSGADIEGVVKESIEDTYANEKSELTTQAINEAIKNTHSLKEIMKDKLEKMDTLYKERKYKNASV